MQNSFSSFFIMQEGDHYTLWVGSTFRQSESNRSSIEQRLVSTDGLVWSNRTNTNLVWSNAGYYQLRGLRQVRMEGAMYQAWEQYYYEDTGHGWGLSLRYLTSADGLTWTVVNRPALMGAFNVSALKSGTTYHLWANPSADPGWTGNRALRHRTSASPGAGWGAWETGGALVLVDGSTQVLGSSRIRQLADGSYQMYYVSGNTMKLATSSNGTNFTTQNPQVFLLDQVLPSNAIYAHDFAVVPMYGQDCFFFDYCAHESSSGYCNEGYMAMSCPISPLTIDKAVQNPLALPQDVVTYTVSFTNTGTLLSSGILLTDVVPLELVTVTYQVQPGLVVTPTGSVPLAWEVEPLAPGESGKITITGVLSACHGAGYTFPNTAVITATVPADPNPAGNEDTAWVMMLNAPPQANDDLYSTAEDTVLNVPLATGVLANDGDPNCDSLSVTRLSGPAHGLLLLRSDGSFVYTPTLNFNGADTFTYRLADGALADTAVVTITILPVNDAPLAVDDHYTTTEDTPLLVAAPGVLANDGDVEGDPLTSALAVPPLHGVASLASNGSFAYTPTLNYNGADSFTYRLSDGALTDTAVVWIDVIPVNDAPVAVDDFYTTTEDTPLLVAAPGVLANDGDVDSDPLSSALAVPPQHGVVALSGDGSFVYTPTLNFNGTDSFTFIVSDGALTGTAVAWIEVLRVNNPPVAVDDLYTTTVDIPLSVAAPGVLGNDFDQEGSPLTAAVDSLPALGTLVLSADGSFIYLPAAGFTGQVTFTYSASDGVDRSDIATVLILVLPTNQPPVAVAGPDQQVQPGAPVTLDGQGSFDPDGNYPLTYYWTQTGGPTVPLNPSAGQTTFTAPSMGTLTFTLVVTDQLGLRCVVPDIVVVSVERQVYDIFLPLMNKSIDPWPQWFRPE